MEEKKWAVYKHTAPNGKVYIGITSQKPTYRWSNGMKYSDQPLFFSAIVKYGWINFAHEIIADGLTYEEAADTETKMIAECKSAEYEYGYNISGGAAVFHTESFEKKPMSEATKAAKRIKQSEAIKRSWQDPDVRKRRLDGLKENAKKPEYRKSVSDGLKKSLASEEARKRRSDMMKERMKDESFKAASISNLIKANKERVQRPVRCITTGEEFPSITEAAKKMNTTQSVISKALRGVVKNPRYKWEYIDRGVKKND